MNSPLQRIEQITKHEALHHSNAAWEAHRRLMRRCLRLKLSSSGLLTKDDERRTTLDGVASENTASKAIGSSMGKRSTDEQFMPPVNAGDADRRGIEHSQSMDNVGQRKTAPSIDDNDTTIIRHSQSLDSNNRGGGNTTNNNNKRKRGTAPSVADLSTRNMILQHFSKLQKKK